MDAGINNSHTPTRRKLGNAVSTNPPPTVPFSAFPSTSRAAKRKLRCRPGDDQDEPTKPPTPSPASSQDVPMQVSQDDDLPPGSQIQACPLLEDFGYLLNQYYNSIICDLCAHVINPSEAQGHRDGCKSTIADVVATVAPASNPTVDSEEYDSESDTEEIDLRSIEPGQSASPPTVSLSTIAASQWPRLLEYTDSLSIPRGRQQRLLREHHRQPPPAIEGLPVHSGFVCPVDNCGYAGVELDTMNQHYSRSHKDRMGQPRYRAADVQIPRPVKGYVWSEVRINTSAQLPPHNLFNSLLRKEEKTKVAHDRVITPTPGLRMNAQYLYACGFDAWTHAHGIKQIGMLHFRSRVEIPHSKRAEDSALLPLDLVAKQLLNSIQPLFNEGNRLLRCYLAGDGQ